MASVIAARRDGPVPDEFSQDDFHGVAWGVDLLQMTTVAFGSADPVRNYEGTAVAEVGSDVDQITRWVTEAASVDFVNMSFGVTGLVENYLGKDFGPDYAQAVETLAQPGGRVFVFAAGNSNEHRCEAPEPGCVEGRMRATSPDVSAGLPVLEASLRGHVVAVVATDADGRIAAFSNRCGIAAKWCIAAPGDLVPTATSVPHLDDASRRLRGYEWGGKRNLLRRAACDRRAGGAEALVPEPDGERRAARASLRDGAGNAGRGSVGRLVPGRISISTATGAPASSRPRSAAASWTWAPRPRRSARLPLRWAAE